MQGSRPHRFVVVVLGFMASLLPSAGDYANDYDVNATPILVVLLPPTGQLAVLQRQGSCRVEEMCFCWAKARPVSL